jgi:hypothetical protein
VRRRWSGNETEDQKPFTFSTAPYEPVVPSGRVGGMRGTSKTPLMSRFSAKREDEALRKSLHHSKPWRSLACLPRFPRTLPQLLKTMSRVP